MSENSIPKEAAYQIINDELMLDGNPRLNLASFVTTWMEPECDKLIMAAINKNYVDMDEYPVTTELQVRTSPDDFDPLTECGEFFLLPSSCSHNRAGRAGSWSAKVGWSCLGPTLLAQLFIHSSLFFPEESVRQFTSSCNGARANNFLFKKKECEIPQIIILNKRGPRQFWAAPKPVYLGAGCCGLVAALQQLLTEIFFLLFSDTLVCICRTGA
jgi:hypothetical protein